MAVSRAVVLDSSAVLALFLEEPSAGLVDEALRAGDARMSSVNTAEVVDVMIRVYSGEPDEVVARVDQLLSSVVRPIETSFELSTRAGELRARLFHRRTRRLSIADCYVLAVAGPGELIATTDTTLASVAREEGFELVPLA
jgi:PIN domain nuclease of toxin-antitoxin system